MPSRMKPWHKTWPQRLEFERHDMKRRHPDLVLHETPDGPLIWRGALVHGRRGTYHVLIEYPDDFPISSPRVYPTQPNDDAGFRERFNRAPHTFPDGSLCLSYPSFNNPSASAADVADAATVWLLAFENYVEAGRWPDPSMGAGGKVPNPRGVTVNIRDSNIGNVVIGETVQDLQASIVDASRSLPEDVFGAVTIAVAQSSDLDDDRKAEFLRQLEVLVTEARQIPEKRKMWFIKPIYAALHHSLSNVASLAQIWGIWGPAIARTLQLGG